MIRNSSKAAGANANYIKPIIGTYILRIYIFLVHTSIPYNPYFYVNIVRIKAHSLTMQVPGNSVLPHSLTDPWTTAT